MLESLILANNRTGHFGAKAIANAIPKNSTLLHLDMTTNDIDDEGLRYLAESLEDNETLVSMKLYWNHFGQPSLEAYHKLMKDQKRGSDWFFDFVTYYVDGKLQMAFLETKIPYDVGVSSFYVAK